MNESYRYTYTPVVIDFTSYLQTFKQKPACSSKIPHITHPTSSLSKKKKKTAKPLTNSHTNIGITVDVRSAKARANDNEVCRTLCREASENGASASPCAHGRGTRGSSWVCVCVCGSVICCENARGERKRERGEVIERRWIVFSGRIYFNGRYGMWLWALCVEWGEVGLLIWGEEVVYRVWVKIIILLCIEFIRI